MLLQFLAAKTVFGWKFYILSSSVSWFVDVHVVTSVFQSSEPVRGFDLTPIIILQFVYFPEIECLHIDLALLRTENPSLTFSNTG